MKVKTVQQHDGEGKFPSFPAGEKVTITGQECLGFRHWFPCEIGGHKTYVPESFMSDGALVREYNPTELIQNKGDILELLEIVNAWSLAKNEKGEIGWIPMEALVSML